MREKVLMLISSSGYDALSNYMFELGGAFEDMGYSVEYLDGRKVGYEEELYQRTLINEYKAIFACNAILTGWEKLVLKNSIFCCLMFDHPVHLFQRIECATKQVVIIHCDQKSTEYIAQHCPNVGGVFFVPLSGSYIKETCISYKERRYDVVFTGSYNDSTAIYSRGIRTMDKDIRHLADALIEYMKEDPRRTLQEGFSLVLQRFHIELQDREFYEWLYQMRSVEAYMRAWIREEVVRGIVDSGQPVHIFGRDWEQFTCHHPENIIRMDGCGEEALRAVANAKIALNVMPWFRGGFQERIATAMLSGSIALTDDSTYIRDNFIEGEDLVVYPYCEWDGIGKQIKYLLSHEEIAAAIATKGYECAHKSHTWKHRAVQIMEAVDEGIKSFQTIMDQAVAVSVIVPVHNAQATLAQTLGNLVHQTLQAIEIILVDDASTDNSLEIMKRCEAQFPDKVMIIQLEQNMGAGGARNIGLQYASGQYIGFVDSDDIVDPTMFEKMYLQGIDRDSDLIEVAYYKEETDETILYTDPAWEGELDGEKRAKLIFGAGGYIWSRLFRRELFLGMSTIFRENCILEDCDFMLEVFMRARNITTIQEVLYRYRYFPTSLSRNTDLEYYYKNAMNAMRSIYDRLYLLEGYRQVQAPVEAVICKLYSCTLNQCVKRYLGGKVKGGNKEIADLVECKRKVVSIEIDQNPYLPREMGRLDIELMKAIERVY